MRRGEATAIDANDPTSAAATTGATPVRQTVTDLHIPGVLRVVELLLDDLRPPPQHRSSCS